MPSIWKEQGQVIVGDAANDSLGTSVALSADANTLVVGAPGFLEGKEGYVRVYQRKDIGGNMTQLGQTMYGEAVGDIFGYSVDITADGKILAIGSPGIESTNGTRPGYVRVYKLDELGSSWNQLGQNISGEVIGNKFGYSVSLSDDGKTLAVGALGYVRIYRLGDDGSSWEQLGQDNDGEAHFENGEFPVSLSANGTTVAIGAPWNSDNGERSGHVKVYQIDNEGSSWKLLGQIISGEVNYGYFGWFVDVSADGKKLAIGSAGYKSGQPAFVRVYSLESSDDSFIWKQLGEDITTAASGDEFGSFDVEFGSSGSLSVDGKTLAVGASLSDGIGGVKAGHVSVYRMDDSSSSWLQHGEDIDDEAAGDHSQFVSISLSADGKTVAIGSYGNGDNNSGHVRVFAME